MIETNVRSAGVLALGIIIAAAIGSYAFYQVKALSNTLSVTGSATATTTADAAKWTISVSRSAFEDSLASSQAKVSNDAQQVINYLGGKGIAAEKITASPVFVDQEYSNDQNAPRRYNVHEDITVQWDDVRLIDRLSKDITTLSNRGIILSVRSPEYYVSTLPQIRISLIGSAVKDARARAEEIAKSTGQKVGRLQSAASGVVQVMAPNSVDISDYGSYDTSTIDKQVMVTTRAVFLVR